MINTWDSQTAQYDFLITAIWESLNTLQKIGLNIYLHNEISPTLNNPLYDTTSSHLRYDQYNVINKPKTIYKNKYNINVFIRTCDDDNYLVKEYYHDILVANYSYQLEESELKKDHTYKFDRSEYFQRENRKYELYFHFDALEFDQENVRKILNIFKDLYSNLPDLFFQPSILSLSSNFNSTYYKSNSNKNCIIDHTSKDDDIYMIHTFNQAGKIIIGALVKLNFNCQLIENLN